MATTWLSQVIIDIEKTGFFDYALPFMVTFAIFYGILEKTKIFGKKSGKINMVFSLVFSLTILPFVQNVNYTTYLAKMAFIIVGFVCLAMILGIIGYRFEKMKNALLFGLIAVFFIIATEFFHLSFSNLPAEALYFVLVAAVFLIIVWFVTGAKQEPIREIKIEKKTAPKKKQEEQPVMPQITVGDLIEQLKSLPEEQRKEELAQLALHNPQLAKVIEENM
ncbi:hypothetical protein JXB27_00550 [Candidatus Woesearchaeota archaeon]|nr:hypothetical protein [Candidatus Woesearchaeota archaeon]